MGLAYHQSLLAAAALCWLADELSSSNLAQAVTANSAKVIPGAELFTNGAVHRIRIRIATNELLALRQSNREYVRATVEDGASSYQEVGIHLKGATGSFRSLDQKPALTLNFAKFKPEQSFHGLRKLHLNNSV